MALNRFHLSGPSIEVLRRQVRAEYGPEAVIVRAEAVTVGGLGGFLARHHYEVTVELPDAAAPSTDPLPVVKRTGIAALLADADTAEAALNAVPVSTESGEFSSFLKDLESAVDPAAGAAGSTPATAAAGAHRPPWPLDGPGDLIVVAGPGRDALEAGRSLLAPAAPAALLTAGALRVEGLAHVADRRAATEARAAGVLAGAPVVVAFGLGYPSEAFVHLPALALVGFDQLWLAVDATRKHGDTVSWVEAVEAVAEPDAVAAFSRRDTATPDTVQALRFPVSWVDDAPEVPARPAGPSSAAHQTAVFPPTRIQR
ncbi:hypothetical protein [Arthrobacter zhaoguopingii]|uniref:hypothetical protein n=1 Tax=Arthrobacter zhaoguopingii TaxID=2681491 RepID=UPI00135CBDE2|nr:hypothetical protein [Arthrobacter zhaoguopingii]